MTHIEVSPPAAPTGAGPHQERASSRTPEMRPHAHGLATHAAVNLASAPLSLPLGATCTPSLARVILAILFAPLLALLEARIAAMLNQFVDLMQQWQEGKLPPPPPEHPYTPRPATPRPYSARPVPGPSWLEALFALAASDQPNARSRPRARRASAAHPEQSLQGAGTGSRQPAPARARPPCVAQGWERTRPIRRATRSMPRASHVKHHYPAHIGAAVASRHPITRALHRSERRKTPLGPDANLRPVCYDIKSI